MKVTVERSELLKSLGHVHRVVERRNTIPILANVLMRADRSKLEPQGHRSRRRSDRHRSRPRWARRLDHGAGAHVLRHRAQAARGRADRSGILRRPRRAGDPRRPLALHPADPAGERFSRSGAGRDDPQIHAQGRRPQAADRQDPVRHLDRGDPLLPQRHLPARRQLRQSANLARGGDRRPPPGADGARLAQRRRRHAGHHRAAQDGRRGAAPDRGQRSRGRDRIVVGKDPLHASATRC